MFEEITRLVVLSDRKTMDTQGLPKPGNHPDSFSKKSVG